VLYPNGEQPGDLPVQKIDRPTADDQPQSRDDVWYQGGTGATCGSRRADRLAVRPSTLFLAVRGAPQLARTRRADTHWQCRVNEVKQTSCHRRSMDVRVHSDAAVLSTDCLCNRPAAADRYDGDGLRAVRYVSNLHLNPTPSGASWSLLSRNRLAAIQTGAPDACRCKRETGGRSNAGAIWPSAIHIALDGDHPVGSS
jgi:hypothetical protein